MRAFALLSALHLLGKCGLVYLNNVLLRNNNKDYVLLSVPLKNPKSIQLVICWSDEESEKPGLSAKKRRVETFQQKEKRKRDFGQATSDKNFVEEEKRILRQKIEWGPNFLHPGNCLQCKSFPSAGSIHCIRACNHRALFCLYVHVIIWSSSLFFQDCEHIRIF